MPKNEASCRITLIITVMTPRRPVEHTTARSRHQGDQLDDKHGPDARNVSAGGINHARVGAQNLGRTVAIEAQCQDRRASPWSARKRDLSCFAQGGMRWAQARIRREAGPGDFILPYTLCATPEINADPENVLECVLCDPTTGAVVVNIHRCRSVEKPEEVYWVDPITNIPG